MCKSFVRPHDATKALCPKHTPPATQNAPGRGLLRLAGSSSQSLTADECQRPRQARPLRRNSQNRDPFLHRLSFAGIEWTSDPRVDQFLDPRFGHFEDERTAHQHGEDSAVDLQRPWSRRRGGSALELGCSRRLWSVSSRASERLARCPTRRSWRYLA